MRLMDCRLIRRGGMATTTTELDWQAAVAVFRASLPRRGVWSQRIGCFWKRCIITWRALPKRFGKWNGVWKRFDRLSKAAVFEMFFDRLASFSSSALVKMFGSTVVRAYVSPIFHSAIY
jgi:hypothetical protein